MNKVNFAPSQEDFGWASKSLNEARKEVLKDFDEAVEPVNQYWESFKVYQPEG